MNILTVSQCSKSKSSIPDSVWESGELVSKAAVHNLYMRGKHSSTDSTFVSGFEKRAHFAQKPNFCF